MTTSIISHFQLLLILGQIGVPFPSTPQTDPSPVVQQQQVPSRPVPQIPQSSVGGSISPSSQSSQQSSEIESTAPGPQTSQIQSLTPGPQPSQVSVPSPTPSITEQVPAGLGNRIETGIGSVLGGSYAKVIESSDGIANKFEAAWAGLYAPGSLFSQLQKALLPFTVIGVSLWVFALVKDATEKGFLSDEAKYRLLWLLGVAMLLGNDGVLLGGTVRALNQIVFVTNSAVLEVTVAGVSNKDNIRAAQLNAELVKIHSRLVQQCLDKKTQQDADSCVTSSKEEALKILQEQNASVINQLGAAGKGLFRSFTEQLTVGADVAGTVVLYAISSGFYSIIRISLFIWASSAPLWVAITLFPIRTRGFVIFLTGVWSIGMVIVSYTMIQGTIAFFFAVFAASTPTLVAIMSGIFAPIAAIMISAGSSIALVTGLSAVAAKTAQVAVNVGVKAASGGGV